MVMVQCSASKVIEKPLKAAADYALIRRSGRSGGSSGSCGSRGFCLITSPCFRDTLEPQLIFYPEGAPVKDSYPKNRPG